MITNKLNHIRVLNSWEVKQSCGHLLILSRSLSFLSAPNKNTTIEMVATTIIVAILDNSTK